MRLPPFYRVFVIQSSLARARAREEAIRTKLLILLNSSSEIQQKAARRQDFSKIIE
jgi:hypothetical protein